MKQKADTQHIYALRYLDACYRDAEIRKASELLPSTHVAIGEVTLTRDAVRVLFVTSSTLKRGLLIPKGAVITSRTRSLMPERKRQITKGKEVHVTWNDIVHFEQRQIPKLPTRMHTIGKVAFMSKDAIVIEAPTTYKLVRGRKVAHPKYPPRYYAIPHGLIHAVTPYAKTRKK